MSVRLKCQCGWLTRWANDPGTPFRYDSQTGAMSLDLSAAVSIADPFCIFCGGYPGFAAPRPTPRCHCGIVTRCEQDPTLPVEISGTGTHYTLRCLLSGELNWLTIWYCPACGGLA